MVTTHLAFWPAGLPHIERDFSISWQLTFFLVDRVYMLGPFGIGHLNFA